MRYDFDKVIDRRGTNCLKWDALQERYGNPDLTALWVADTDFATPPFIMEALRKRLDHPILGYTPIPDDYFESIIHWLKKRYGWNVKREELSFIPGIVRGIGMVINVFTSPGDKIIIQPPVYHPFRLVPEGNGREVVYNPLIQKADGRYEMDFEQLESVAEGCKLLILSHPHNPGGQEWDEETLRRLADFCHQRGIIVIADEIHADMTLRGRHKPFAMVSEAAAQCSITFGAPSKTFNIPGVVSSWAVVPNEAIRDRFYSWMTANEFNDPTLFAPIATIAAYSPEGEEWLAQMVAYVKGNVDYVKDFCSRNLPKIKPIEPDAGFLMWLDCRDMGMTQPELVAFFQDRCGLALNDGEMFGKEGIGFMRLNVGCPKSILTQALNAIKNEYR